ncbi:MAG: endolytic transglycosylase MltG [Flavobacteriales bacterium]
MAKKGKGSKIALFLLLAILGVGTYLGYPYAKIWWEAKQPALNIKTTEIDFFVPTGADADTVLNRLEGMLANPESFSLLAEKMNYSGSNVVPGKYVLNSSMTNRDLITHLRAGRGRVEVNVTFNNIRLLEDLCERMAENIEATPEDLLALLTNEELLSKYGFNNRTIISMFLPDTYRMQWNTSAQELIDRMATEYKKFWNEDRKTKAKALNMSQSQVVTLASILYEEQKTRLDEHPKIAGLYINRLRDGWPLQSDPTVKFALGDFEKKRIYFADLEVNSPYNTYKNKGLPPGPICMPSKSAIDAVLNYEKHGYYFMCAQPGGTGYHNFAKTNAQHEVYAKQYHQWQNKVGVK